jgi:hypothetical protein
MGFAPHSNTDVDHQARAGIIPTTCPMLLGLFVETEYGNTFEYAERRWPDDDLHPEMPHIIYVGNGQPRLGKVLKTVAWILTGEGEIQKWQIKNHRIYKTEWIGRS